MSSDQHNLADSGNEWSDALRADDNDTLDAIWSRFSDRVKPQVIELLDELMIENGEPDSIDLSGLQTTLQKEGRSKSRGTEQLWQLIVLVSLNTLKRADESGSHISAEVARQLQTTEGLADFVISECRRLLKILAYPDLEARVIWKLKFVTNEEIATRLDYTRRTVQRMLSLVREIWMGEL